MNRSKPAPGSVSRLRGRFRAPSLAAGRGLSNNQSRCRHATACSPCSAEAVLRSPARQGPKKFRGQAISWRWLLGSGRGPAPRRRRLACGTSHALPHFCGRACRAPNTAVPRGRGPVGQIDVCWPSRCSDGQRSAISPARSAQRSAPGAPRRRELDRLSNRVPHDPLGAGRLDRGVQIIQLVHCQLGARRGADLRSPAALVAARTAPADWLRLQIRRARDPQTRVA